MTQGHGIVYAMSSTKRKGSFVPRRSRRLKKGGDAEEDAKQQEPAAAAVFVTKDYPSVDGLPVGGNKIPDERIAQHGIGGTVEFRFNVRIHNATTPTFAKLKPSVTREQAMKLVACHFGFPAEEWRRLKLHVTPKQKVQPGEEAWEEAKKHTFTVSGRKIVFLYVYAPRSGPLKKKKQQRTTA